MIDAEYAALYFPGGDIGRLAGDNADWRWKGAALQAPLHCGGLSHGVRGVVVPLGGLCTSFTPFAIVQEFNTANDQRKPLSLKIHIKTSPKQARAILAAHRRGG